MVTDDFHHLCSPTALYSMYCCPSSAQHSCWIPALWGPAHASAVQSVPVLQVHNKPFARSRSCKPCFYHPQYPIRCHKSNQHSTISCTTSDYSIMHPYVCAIVKARVRTLQQALCLSLIACMLLAASYSLSPQTCCIKFALRTSDAALNISDAAR